MKLLTRSSATVLSAPRGDGRRGRGEPAAFPARPVLLVAAAAVLSACVAGMPIPAYSPIEVGLSFGYSDEPLSDTRFRVTYLAPMRTSYAYDGAQRTRESQRQIAFAYDMAVWRAADLALAKGFPAFRVSERDNDARVDLRYEYFDDGPYGPFFHHRGHFHYGPFGSIFAPGYYDRYALLSARVTIVTDVAEPAAPDSLDVRGTLDRMYRKYPQMIGPRAAADPEGTIGERGFRGAQPS